MSAVDSDAPAEPSAHGKLIQSLSAWLERAGIIPDAMDGFLASPFATPTIDALSKRYVYERRHSDADISRVRVAETLEVLVDDLRAARRRKIVGDICSDRHPDGDEQVARFVEACCGSRDPLAIAVVRHFVWNGKRLMLGMKSEHDLMVVLFSRGHGSGKSRAAELLSGPLHELAVPCKVDIFNDSRQTRVLAMACVAIWDEMGGAAKADIEALKNAVTAHTVAYRPMKTNDTVVLRRTCQFIGTSNLPINALVSDTTGARRFYQLDCRERLDWAAINAIDYSLLWRCVDVRDPMPIAEQMPSLRDHQRCLIYQDQVAQWMAEEDFGRLSVRHVDLIEGLGSGWARDGDNAMSGVRTVEPYDPARGCSFQDLAIRYRQWARVTGQAGISSTRLGTRLRELGWSTSRAVVGGRASRTETYLMPADLLDQVVARRKAAPGPSGTVSDSAHEAYDGPF